MAWVQPQYSRGQVDAAGRILVPALTVGSAEPPEDSEAALNDALTIINNWRASHSYPLLAFRMTLTKRARGIDDRVVIAQRLKRLSSIQVKLMRNPKMALSRVHDIGGCRAVVRNVARVNRIVRLYEDSHARNPHVRAEFVRKYDYIAQPKEDGYRKRPPCVQVSNRVCPANGVERPQDRNPGSDAASACLGDRRRDGRYIHESGIENGRG